jgi:hypothetical protein
MSPAEKCADRRATACSRRLADAICCSEGLVSTRRNSSGNSIAGAACCGGHILPLAGIKTYLHIRATALQTPSIRCDEERIRPQNHWVSTSSDSEHNRTRAASCQLAIPVAQIRNLVPSLGDVGRVGHTRCEMCGQSGLQQRERAQTLGAFGI